MVLTVRRISAALIDFAIISMGWWLFANAFNLMSVVWPEIVSPMPGTGDFLLRLPVPAAIYNGFLAASRFGGTAGMRICKINLFQTGGGQVSLWRSGIRALIFWETFAFLLRAGLDLFGAVITGQMTLYSLWTGVSLIAFVPLVSSISIAVSHGQISFHDVLTSTGISEKVSHIDMGIHARALEVGLFLSLVLCVCMGLPLQVLYSPLQRYVEAYPEWRLMAEGMMKRTIAVNRDVNRFSRNGVVGAGCMKIVQGRKTRIGETRWLEAGTHVLRCDLGIIDISKARTVGLLPILSEWGKINRIFLKTGLPIRVDVITVSHRAGLYFQLRRPYWLTHDTKTERILFTPDKDEFWWEPRIGRASIFSFIELAWQSYLRVWGLANPLRNYRLDT